MIKEFCMLECSCASEIVCACASVCECACACVHVCMCACVHVCMCASVCVWCDGCMCMWKCVYWHIPLFYVCIFMCICYVCVKAKTKIYSKMK